MTSRLARLWQPGNPQQRCFLPDFWMAVIEAPKVGKHRLPPNCVKFECDPRMSRNDIREYLTKIYELPVRDVRTEVQMGEILWNSKLDHRYKRAIWKDNDKKFAYVFMTKGFEFKYPDIFFRDDDLEELTKVKEQQETAQKNSRFVNRDRGGVAPLLGL